MAALQRAVMNPPNSQAAPGPPPPTATHRPEFFVQLDRFWHRVTEGLEISQLWKQFSADARSSYRLYHRDFQARSPQETRKPGFWHTAQEYVWAILEKLTPAARLIITLLEIEDRSVKEISSLTGWSVPLVKVRAFRARAEMKKVLAKLTREKYL